MIKRLIFSLLGTLLTYLSLAQSNPWSTTKPPAAVNDRINVASPNVAGLGQYGTVPVNLSTGQIAQNIPLYDLQYHDISVPISLSYSYQGFKPNDHPSWAGLGWNLNAGGIITRIKHGEPDEMKVTRSSGSTITEVMNNTNYLPENYSVNPGNSARLILANLNPTNTGNYSADFNALVERQRVFTMNAASSTYANSTNLYDTEPDEFIFNFNGFSGKFVYAANTGKYLVTTNSNETFEIEHTIDSNLSYNNGTSVILSRYINKFTIKTHDGYIYEFGGNYENDHNMELYLGMPRFGAIEPDHPGVSGAEAHERGNSIYVSGWYLTKITSPQGAIVTFSYKRSGYSVLIYPSLNLERLGPEGGIHKKNSNYNSYSLPINTTSYLDKITAGTRTVEFLKSNTYTDTIDTRPPNGYYISRSEEIIPDYIKRIGTTEEHRLSSLTATYAYYYDDLCVGDTRMRFTFPNYWQKLTQINIKDNNEQLHVFDFNYYQRMYYGPLATDSTSGDSKTGRLELKSILMSTNANQRKPYYSFKYYAGGTNPENYGTRKTDHWGFYNDNDYFPALTDTTSPIAEATAANAELYRISRNPNCIQGSTGNCGNIGGLTEITYPTGGRTVIEYEHNDYSGRMKYSLSANSNTSQLLLQNESSNVIAGGFRVKSTTSYAAPDISGAKLTAPVKKEYYYVNNYTNGGTVSSGILNSGMPNYYYAYENQFNDNISYLSGPISATPPYMANYGSIRSYSTIPDFFEGTFLTYSNVIEKNADGGFIIHHFSNSDNADYIDKVIKNQVDPTAAPFYKTGFPFQWYLSKDAERGKLLDESYYTAGKQLVKKVSYTYNNDPDRYLNAVNSMRKEGIPFGLMDGTNIPFYSIRSYLIPHFTYYGFLKDKTDTYYDNSGNVQIVNNISSQFDDYRNLTAQITRLDGQMDHATFFRYPNSFPAAPANTGNSFIEGLKSLQDKKLFKYPVEQTEQMRSGSTWYVTSGTLNEYYPDMPIIKSKSTFETASPVNSYSYINTSISSSGVSKDARYRTNVLYPSYSSTFHYPLTTTSDNGSTSVIRSLDDQHILAVAKNARSNDIAYTSFEEPDNSSVGNWQLNPAAIQNYGMRLFTDHTYKLAGNSITSKHMLEVGKEYTVSLWYRVNGDIPKMVMAGQNYQGVTDASTAIVSPNGTDMWRYQEFNFTATSDQIMISGSNQEIDELRLYPKASGMETYNYDVRNRIDVKMDAANKVLFYGYDQWDRLTEIRNGSKLESNGFHELLKKYEYKLNEPE